LNSFEAQLKHTCRLTGARWAVWLERVESGWVFGLRHALTGKREKMLWRFLAEGRTASWLAGAYSGGRMRIRQTGDAADGLGCRQVYVFPHPAGRQALLVGVDTLSNEARNFWRILALVETNPSEKASPFRLQAAGEPVTEAQLDQPEPNKQTGSFL
jgi:hypothetical protein